MRFYNIEISEPDTDELIRRYTSIDSSGNTILGALNIEIDAPVYQFALPMGNDTIRVWGISLEEIQSASNYNNKTMRVYAGMSKGLPLADPDQQGLILEGVINQCFGNWQGVDMTLDFVIVYGIGGTPLEPKNISLNWEKGITLGAAVKATLAVAAPTVKCTDTTSGNLVLNQDEVGFYQNMQQFSEYVKTVSMHIIKDTTYPGVNINYRNNEFFIVDGTNKENPKDISFFDLIGQPTWLAPNSIQFKTCLRADLNLSDYITLPQGQVTTAAQSQSQFRDKSILQGVFQLDQIRHVGNFRQPDASSWVTIFDCHPV